MSLIQDLTIFGDDDATPLLGTVDVNGNVTLATCSTDPTHPRPYLRPVLQASDASIRFMDGSSTIGAASIEVVDATTVAGDQTQGWFTNLLASGTSQNTQILMRRAVLRQQDSDGTWRNVFDGIIVDPELAEDMVTYKFQLRTARERERKNPIFQHALGTSIVPPGVVNGYGNIAGVGSLAGVVSLIIPPAGWEYGIFRRDPAWGSGGIYTGHIDLHDPNRYSTAWWSKWSTERFDTLQTMGQPMAVFDPASAGYIDTQYAGVAVQWRDTATAPPWKLLQHMPYNNGTQFNTANAFIVTDRGITSSPGHGSCLSYITISSRTLADLPADGQAVDVRVLSALYPTKAYPMFIECTFGKLLKDIYDGVYSYDTANFPKVRYDTTVMAALVTNTPIARAIIDGPVDDMFQWLSENIYKPLLMAPAENENGYVVPVSAELPDASLVIPQISDAQVYKGQWKHTKEDACTSVTGVYQRDSIKPPDPANFTYQNFLQGRGFDMSNAFDRLQSIDITFARVFATSVLFGDKPFKLEAKTMRSVSNSLVGQHYNGSTVDEVGAQLIQGKAFKMIDRFSQGAQRLVLDCNASDPVIRGLKLGGWTQTTISWLPDYKNRKRGCNRLMQVIASRQTDPITRQLTLLDSGPWGVPISQPTIGNIRLSNRALLVDVTIMPVDVGASARLEYNFGATQPVATDPGWTFMGRVTALATLSTPPLSNGITVWVRSRGEKPASRYSAWTNPLSLSIVLLPVINDAHLDTDLTSTPELSFKDNGNVLSVQVDYLLTTNPDDLSALGTTIYLSTATLPVSLGVAVPTGKYMKTRITPYSGWTGSTVSGTAGDPVTLMASATPGSSSSYIPPVVVETRTESADGTLGTLQLQLIDPQLRLDHVSMRTQVGNSTPSAWVTVVAAGGFYTQTVTLVDKQPSKIEYRIYSLDSGSVVNLLEDETVGYSIGSRPMAPQVKYLVNPVNGKLQAKVYGDWDTYQTFCAIRVDRPPSDAEIQGGLAGPVSSRLGTFDGPVIATGQMFYIGAKSQNSTGVWSEPAFEQRPYLGTGTTPDAIVTLIGNPSIQADRVIWNLQVDINTAELWCYMKCVDVNPAGVPDIENLMAGPFKLFDVLHDNLTPGVTFPVTLPLLGAGFTQEVCFVPYNPMAKAGVKVTAKAVGLGGGAPAKPAAPALSSTSTGQTVQVVRATLVAGIATIRLRDAGTILGDTAVLAADITAGYKDVTLSGLVPSSTHSFTGTVISTAGAESDQSVALVVTMAAATPSGVGTGTNGKLLTPTFTGVYDPTHESAVLTVTNASSFPSGTVFHALVSPTSNGSYVEDVYAATTLNQVYSEFARAKTSAFKYYALFASCTGYTQSDTTTIPGLSINMPGYTMV